MDENHEELFNQLANDEHIAAAIADHEAACAQQIEACPICMFFNMVHELRHFSEALDSNKILDLTDDPAAFLDDAMVIIQFMTESTRNFLQVVSYLEEIETLEEEDPDD